MGFLTGILDWVAFCLGILIVGLLTAFLVVRGRILRQVEKELGGDAVLLNTGARIGFLDAAQDAKPSASAAGMLMLLSTGLYFHSWLGSQEMFIPGPSISWLGMPDARGLRRAERRSIIVRFLNSEGKEVGMVMRLMYPEQWVEAIKTHLITRSV